MKAKLLFLVVSLSLASCATLAVEDHARETDEKEWITKTKRVPAFVFDAVTFPIQVFWFAHLLNHH